MDFNVGRSNNWPTEMDFLNLQSVGQTEKGADVVGVKDIVEDENYWIFGYCSSNLG